jgi:hypothetical protein
MVDVAFHQKERKKGGKKEREKGRKKRLKKKEIRYRGQPFSQLIMLLSFPIMEFVVLVVVGKIEIGTGSPGGGCLPQTTPH